MTIDTAYPNSCSEEFAELCALSTTGEMSAKELAILNEHVAGCAQCMALLREYAVLVHVSMAKLAADRTLDTEIEIPVSYDETGGATQFASALRAQRSPSRVRLSSLINQIRRSDGWKTVRRQTQLGTAAALLLACLGGAFELGRRMNVDPIHPASLAVVIPPPVADEESAQLRAELEAAQNSLKAATGKSANIQKQLATLLDTKASLLTQIAELTNKNQVDSDSLAAVAQQRDVLQDRFDAASKALSLTHEELNRVQQDRQGALFQVATLQTRIEDLHTQLTSTNNSAGTTRSSWLQIVTSVN